MSGMLAVLMAGGSGTRFWPASRQARPKQLLPIGGELPLIVATSRRLAPLVPPARQLVITSAATVDAVRALLPEVPADQVVGEPVGRDTAACIGLAARLAERMDPDAVVLAMPSDQVIGPEDAFLEHLQVAEEALAERPHAILVFGVEPDHPATGYGYLRRGAAVAQHRGQTIYELEAFVEKPDRQRAAAMLAHGGYLWNAGLFAFRPAALGEAYARHLPALHEALCRLGRAWRTPGFESEMETVFPTLDKISIDYGVMEKAEGTLMLPLPLRWDDVGSWGALRRLLPADERGNVVEGQGVLIDSDRCVVSAGDGVVAIKGVSDLIVVHTPDATLVCRRDDDQGVKAVVDELRARGLLRYL